MLLVCFEFGAREQHEVVLFPDVSEERLEAVVVLVQNGIELVIVAAGAAVGHPHEHGTHGVGDVGQGLLAAQFDNGLVGFVGEVAIEADRNMSVQVVGVEFVAGDLLADETVVRLVLIEGLNYVIPIAPDIGTRFIGLETIGIGISRQVEPVPAPALAILRGGEQTVHYFRECVGRVIGQEPLHVFGRGR